MKKNFWFGLLAFSLLFQFQLHALLLGGNFDSAAYENLLGKMIHETKYLQNDPNKKLEPQEERIASIVLDELRGLISEQAGAGALTVLRLDYSKNGKRPNLIFKYGGTDPNKVVTFMGSHMDVVPANPEDPEWQGRDPFSMTAEVDPLTGKKKLYGRGVTDCLGHVAMLTMLLKQLATEKPELKQSIVVVFISNEEASNVLGIGIDEVAKHGHLKGLEKGPVYWIDSSDTHILGPRLGTGGIQQFSLTFQGKAGHSGYPSLAINPCLLSAKFICEMDTHFTQYINPKIAAEKKKCYCEHTSCKITQPMVSSAGSLNQIASSIKFGGDIRYSPLWTIEELKNEMNRFVLKFNQRVADGQFGSTQSGSFKLADGALGKVSLDWIGEPVSGFLADMNGLAYLTARAALKEQTGLDLPGFSATGTLPLIKEMQDEGFDLLPMGFGLMSAYHSPGEYGFLEDFELGYNVIKRIIESLEK